MLRVVFAVLLAVALLGVGLPAVEDARVERSATLASGELDAIETAVEDLLSAEEPTHRPGRAARRVVTVDVPRDGFTKAPVSYVVIGGLMDEATADEDATAIAYRVAGRTHVRRLPVEVRVLDPDGSLRPAGEPLVVRGTGDVAFLLLERGGEPIVAVTDGDPGAG